MSFPTMLSSAHVRKPQRGKKLSSCFVRLFDAWQRRHICQSCEYLQPFATSAVSNLSFIVIIRYHHIMHAIILSGAGLTASILSFSAAISACGKAEQWPEALHLLALCEHLDHLDAWQNTQKKTKKKNSNVIQLHFRGNRNSKQNLPIIYFQYHCYRSLSLELSLKKDRI